MATGDQADFVRRIKNELPSRWFPVTGATDTVSATPVLDGLLNGIAAGWAFCHELLHYVKQQTRIATATDVFLDLCSRDYLGNALPRNANESDASFRVRIKAAILRPKATRSAMVQALTNLTGRTPWIFEPANPSDTGGYGTSGMTQGTALAYGTAGGYGSLMLPYQAFIVAYRPTNVGISNVAGYTNLSSIVGMPGGYGGGAIEYGNSSQEVPQITDATIFATVASVEPTASIMWTRISN